MFYMLAIKALKKAGNLVEIKKKIPVQYQSWWLTVYYYFFFLVLHLPWNMLRFVAVEFAERR